MGYILLVRNPRSGKLLAVYEDNEHDNIAEFSSSKEALEAAEKTTACKAWTYGIFQVGLKGA